jgi:hypothetical protein
MLQAMKHYFSWARSVRHRGKTYMEALQADESAMTGNDTCGIRTHTGRPHRLSGPTP